MLMYFNAIFREKLQEYRNPRKTEPYPALPVQRYENYPGFGSSYLSVCRELEKKTY